MTRIMEKPILVSVVLRDKTDDPDKDFVLFRYATHVRPEIGHLINRDLDNKTSYVVIKAVELVQTLDNTHSNAYGTTDIAITVKEQVAS